MDPIIEKYIKKRYQRWLDYSKFHSAQAGIPDEAVDLLSEVLLSLLQKDEELLLRLFNSKIKQYTELDFFVLRMIKLNATSLTAPFRRNYKPIPADENVDYQIQEIEDIQSDEHDRASELLDKYHSVCQIVDRLDLDNYEKQVFELLFIQGETVSGYCEDNTMRKFIYYRYDTIKTTVSTILHQQVFIKKKPTRKLSSRVKNLVFQYNLVKTL